MPNIKATIKKGDKVTHEKLDCEDVHQALKWASVQGRIGFDFERAGSGKTFYVDRERGVTLNLSK